jgi:hypothetical protein
VVHSKGFTLKKSWLGLAVDCLHSHGSYDGQCLCGHASAKTIDLSVVDGREIVISLKSQSDPVQLPCRQ